MDEESIKCYKVASHIKASYALLIGAGAGMGVDSGLPDFRGKEGFWKAYPHLEKLKVQFEDMANPRWFKADPNIAWGFYGHRFNLYRKTQPHLGYSIIKDWINKFNLEHFVFTSNVDGHFQKAGFEKNKIYECHGSLNKFQCFVNCGQEPWTPNSGFEVLIDQKNKIALDPLPQCPRCSNLARPNLLMFSDWDWHSTSSENQQRILSKWIDLRDKKLVVIEIGAGNAIPTVRYACESFAESTGGVLVRINRVDAEITGRGISIFQKGKYTLEKINTFLMNFKN